MKEEVALLEKFVNSGKLKGLFIIGLKLGYKLGEKKWGYIPESWRDESWSGSMKGTKAKEVDAICLEGPDSRIVKPKDPLDYMEKEVPKEVKDVWVFEIKETLNPGAVGQVIIYSHLFSIDYPRFNVKKGIICEFWDPLIVPICEELDIRVFPCK